LVGTWKGQPTRRPPRRASTTAPLFLHANPTLNWHAGSWLTLQEKKKKREEEYNKGMTRRTSDDEHLLELESQNKTK